MRLPARGQSGFMLSTALILLVFFAVVTAGLLAMTSTAFRMSQRHADSTNAIRLADSALEDVINRQRANTLPRDPNDACLEPTYASNLRPPGADEPVVVDVECIDVGSEEATRRFDLAAKVDGSVLAAARIEIDDEPRAGISMTVCDWQLGGATAQPLVSC